jgi:hypothetical protein
MSFFPALDICIIRVRMCKYFPFVVDQYSQSSSFAVALAFIVRSLIEAEAKPVTRNDSSSN